MVTPWFLKLEMHQRHIGSVFRLRQYWLIITALLKTYVSPPYVPERNGGMEGRHGGKTFQKAYIYEYCLEINGVLVGARSGGNFGWLVGRYPLINLDYMSNNGRNVWECFINVTQSELQRTSVKNEEGTRRSTITAVLSLSFMTVTRHKLFLCKIHLKSHIEESKGPWTSLTKPAPSFSASCLEETRTRTLLPTMT